MAAMMTVFSSLLFLSLFLLSLLRALFVLFVGLVKVEQGQTTYQGQCDAFFPAKAAVLLFDGCTRAILAVFMPFGPFVATDVSPPPSFFAVVVLVIIRVIGPAFASSRPGGGRY